VLKNKICTVYPSSSNDLNLPILPTRNSRYLPSYGRSTAHAKTRTISATHKLPTPTPDCNDMGDAYFCYAASASVACAAICPRSRRRLRSPLRCRPGTILPARGACGFKDDDHVDSRPRSTSTPRASASPSPIQPTLLRHRSPSILSHGPVHCYCMIPLMFSLFPMY
jgi:hypothetical protein